MSLLRRVLIGVGTAAIVFTATVLYAYFYLFRGGA